MGMAGHGVVGAFDRAFGVGDTKATLPGTDCRIEALDCLGGNGREAEMVKSGPELARLVQSCGWMDLHTIAVFVSDTGDEYNSE